MKLLLSISFLFLAMGSTQAKACSCAPPAPVKDALATSAEVFSGEVLKVEHLSNGNPFASVRVTLRVIESWKGPLEFEKTLFTASNGAACGVYFREGSQYLVYASYGRAGLSTNLCTRTKSLQFAQDDLDELGPGQTP